MQIKNTEGLSKEQLKHMIEQGGKFVMFKYVVSIVVMTFNRNSDIYFIPPGESKLKHHIGHTALTGLMGWWGIPWGPIHSIAALYKNMSGGTDVTQEVAGQLGLYNYEGYNIPGNDSGTGQPGNLNTPGSNTGNHGEYNIPR